MSKSSQSLVASSPFRVGEGDLVPTRVTNTVKVDGTSVSAFEVNLSQAHVPERRYLADVASVVVHKSDMSLMFAQRRIGSELLRSLLVVRMPAERALMFARSVLSVESPKFMDAVVRQHVEKEELVQIVQEPDQTVALSANMTLMAFSGRESCIDFYQASAFSMAAALKAQKVAVDPVVRIELRTGIVWALVEFIRSYAEKNPEHFDSQEDGE